MNLVTLKKLRRTKLADLAIVVPTLNEQNYIGTLLDSIASQTLKPQEVVVVDAYSEDLSLKEIKKRQLILPQLKVFQIPKYSIARQRNFGARITKSESLLFLDADTKFKDEKTLEEYVEEVQRRQLDMAACENLSLSSYWKNKLYFQGMHILFKASQKIWPMVVGANLFIKKEVFDKVGGFDEKVKIGEDMDLLQRVLKAGGRFDFLKNSKIYTSSRRFDSEGRRRFSLKMLKSFLHVVRKGFKDNPTEYKFGHFK